MHFGEFFRQRQAQTCAAVVTRVCICHLSKWFECLGNVILRYAASCIRDAQGRLTIALYFRADGNQSAWIAKFDTVRKEIEDNLPDHALVALDDWRRRFKPSVNRQRFLFDLNLHDA